MFVTIIFVLGLYEQIVNPQVIRPEHTHHHIADIECAKVVDAGYGVCECDIVCRYVQLCNMHTHLRHNTNML
jgi:hypothetical protein